MQTESTTEFIAEDHFAEVVSSCRKWICDDIRRRTNIKFDRRFNEYDVYQIACIAAFKSLHNFNGSSIEQLVGWFKVVCRSKMLTCVKHSQAGVRNIDMQRSGNFTFTSPSDDEAISEYSALEFFREEANPDEVNDVINSVLRVVNELPEREKGVIQLRFFEGLSLAEIGERLCISIPAVKGLLNRSIRRIKKQAETLECESDLVLKAASKALRGRTLA